MSPSIRASLGLVLLVSLLIWGAQVSTAQESQDRVRRTRPVASFTSIEFSVPGTVHVRQADSMSVEVEGPEETLKKLETVVEDDRLQIRAEGSQTGWLQWLGGGAEIENPIDVYVTTPSIALLSVAGSGKMIGETSVTTSALDLRNAGSGRIDLDLDVDRLKVQVAGSGTVQLRGRADTLTVENAGSGGLQADALETATAEVTIAGSGNVHLHVSDRLTAEIVGSGNVRYRGQPEIDETVMGSGEVRSLE